jgi:hypothetical protein
MESVERLMNGAIDFHVHAGPDPFRERRLDIVELAHQGKEMGMKAIVVKCHHLGTAPLVSLVNKMVPGFTLVGSLTLNGGVGGLSPEVVEVAAKAGAKVIWMPTYSSVVDFRKAKKKQEESAHPATQRVTPQEISLINESNNLLPQVISILEIIKENDMVLGTGHISVEEIYAVTARARQMGVKVTITHPLNTFFGSSLTQAQQKELVAMGAYLEQTFVTCLPDLGGMNPKTIVEHIKAVGEEHCILSTDFGQPSNPSPPEGFRMMVAYMLESGLSEKELQVLIKDNPSKLLGLG